MGRVILTLYFNKYWLSTYSILKNISGTKDTVVNMVLFENL